MDRRGPAREGAVKDERKTLRHVLYGNNPRSLTRRLQAKLNPRADRIKEETACTQASPNSIFHAPRRPRKGPRKLVRKLMQENDLHACQPRAYKVTTISGAAPTPAIADHVKRDFTATAPG